MPTRSTTTWRRGDVALVPIGFTDQSNVKRRPAVIVSSDEYNARSPDVMIASVTSNLLAIRHPGDHLLRDWEAAGLLRPSLVQTKIADFESAIIDGRLGSLSGDDLAALDRGLREALDLS
jgi:mRNA interferase MazF